MAKFPFIIVLALLMVPTSWAQSRFTIDGQVRHRSEIDGRDFDAGASDGAFHLLRTRVGARINPLEDVGVRIQVQDSRMFGSGDPARGRGTLDGRAPGLDFHQAYFEVNQLFGRPAKIRIGRQELAYGNQRLVGSVGWSNVGRTFDGALLVLQGDRVRVDVFAAQLVKTTASPEFGQNLYGVYGVIPGPAVTTDVFLFLDNNTLESASGNSLLNRHTAGLYLHGGKDAFQFQAEAIYQGGRLALDETTAREDIQAYLLSGEAGYTWTTEKGNTGLGILATLLSGDADPSAGSFSALNTLFATNHKFYGFMDLFPRLTGGRGLQDLALRGHVSAGALTFRLDAHRFDLAESIEGVGQQLGHEIDATLVLRYNDATQFQVGASVFSAGRVMEEFLGDDLAYWLYLMTTVNF